MLTEKEGLGQLMGQLYFVKALDNKETVIKLLMIPLGLYIAHHAGLNSYMYQMDSSISLFSFSCF